MQNRYVADVGDFGKHGLLRRLSGMMTNYGLDPLRLGLVWYMHHDERYDGNPDKIGKAGEMVGYLDPERADVESYRECDPDLWKMLGEFVRERKRCVHCVQKSEILPKSTKYYDAMLHYPVHLPRPDRERNRNRSLWLAGAIQATVNADLVCLDPDNSIAKPELMYRQKGPKHTYISDIREFWCRGQSLVIYHHLGMGVTANEQIARAVGLLQDGLTDAEPIPMRYCKGTPRVFLVLPQPEHREIIAQRVNDMLADSWGINHLFERVGG